MTHIYLIRHGEVFNPHGIYYVRLPHFPLSERGKSELEQTAQFLKTKNISDIYTSPMLRAKQSARIMQEELKIPKIYVSKQIIEIRTSFQGKLFTDLDPVQSEVYQSPLRKKSDETIEQITRRMQKFITSLIKKYPNKHIVVVGHGDPIMSLIASVKKLPPKFQSIRTGHYIQHGEVFLLTHDATHQSIKSVFTPSTFSVK